MIDVIADDAAAGARTVPFGQRCGQAILRYLHAHRPKPIREEDDHLFLSLDGVPMTRGSLESMMRRLRIR